MVELGPACPPVQLLPYTIKQPKHFQFDRLPFVRCI